jgi:hypothetical protein
LNSITKGLFLLAALASTAFTSSSVWAQATVQVLDRIAGYSTNGDSPSSEQLNFGQTTSPLTPYYATPQLGAFTACQLAPLGGLTCLDGGLNIRNWPNPTKAPEASSTLFSCANPALGFSTSKPPICTGLAVEQSGAVWLAGANKANSYSLIRVTASPGQCPAGTVPLQNAAYCAQTYATGRPLLQEISEVDGDFGKAFPLGPGTTGVEGQTAIVFFPRSSPGTAYVIASGKSQLGLSGNEQLLSATLASLSASGPFYFVYVTSTGRVLAINATGSLLPPVSLTNITLARGTSRPAGCPGGTDDFGVAFSPKSQRVYVADRAFCQVSAYQVGSPLALTFFQALQTGTMGSDGVAVAPGIAVDLTTCSGTCTFLTAPGGTTPAANMSVVALQDSSVSNMTLFQIKGIPDCRYIGSDPLCAGKNAVVGPAGFPQAQYLDVSVLLPSEIQGLFNGLGGSPGQLPHMYISPQYRGQASKGYVFDAFFGIPQEGLEFKDVFQFEYWVDRLTGSELGCPAQYPPITLPSTELNWDVFTSVSERFETISNGNVNYLDTIMNTGCGSGTGAGGRWSLYAYDLEVSPDTVFQVNGTWYATTQGDDSVFAKLLLGLYYDMGDTQQNLVCAIPPESTTAPLSGSVCSTLQSTWANGLDKLTKCISASTQPKQSSGAQNCTSFQSQLTNYIGTLSAIPAAAPGQDIANRIGELKARAAVVQNIFTNRFLPSIPPNGFVCGSTGSPLCPTYMFTTPPAVPPPQ